MKFLKILLSALVFILALLIIVPLAFRGRILETVKREINKNLDATVEFADLRLSLIRSFPNLSIRLSQLSVVGEGDFMYDTLVSMKSARAVVDIKSLFGDVIKVRSVVLDAPRISTIVLSDGQVNWDIMKDTDAAQDPGDEPVEFLVELQKFEVRNGYFQYRDFPLEVHTVLSNLDLSMHGDLSQDLTTLAITGASDRFDFWFEGIRYIAGAQLRINTHLDADLVNFMFSFREGEVLLNEMEIEVDGFFAMPEDDIEMDINFFSRQTDFRSVLSLVPAIYMSGFEELTATGTIGLEGYIKGFVSDETVPSVGLDLIIEDGGFSYPDLPGSVDNVYANLSLHYDGADEDKTTVDLRRFYLEMAGNPFEMKLGVRNPVSDMEVDLSLNGTIDFTSLADIVPMEEVVLRGLLETDMFFSGRMSDIDNGRYQELNAGGNFDLTAFRYSGPDFPLEISIPGARLLFSPRFAELQGLEIHIGSSDLRMSGRLENFVPYLFNGGILKGNIELSSNLLDLNELLGEQPETEAADTFALALFEVPGNLDLVLASSAARVLYDNMEIDRLKGRIVVRDNAVLMDGVGMEMLDGFVTMTGEYNTSDMAAPFIDFSFNIRDFDIPSSFRTFNTVEQLAPVAGSLRGSFSTSLQMRSLLDDGMMPVLNTLNARGSLRTSGLEMAGSETFNRLATALQLRERRENMLRDVNLSFRISNGRMHVEPFDIRMGPLTMVLGGEQGVDQTINYTARLTVPRSEFGAGADQVISNLIAGAAARGLKIDPGENVNIDARITGTVTDPQISLDLMESARSAAVNVREQLREQAITEIERKVEEVEERVMEEVSQRASQILNDAEQRAGQIRNAAEEAAQAVRREAEANALKVEQQASGRGRIAEAAAKRTADGIRREGSAKADAIVREADQRASRIIEEARTEIDRLRE